MTARRQAVPDRAARRHARARRARDKSAGDNTAFGEMSNELDDFDAFCHVVDDGGFTAAANALDWPKSRVSAAVQRLERGLECRLLERTTRRVRSTAEGENLYGKAAPLFQRLRDLQAEIAAFTETVGGRLRVSAPYEFASHHLGAVACQMLERYPQLEIDIDVHYDPVDLVDQRYDVVFTAIEDALPDSSLVARRIFHLQRGLFAAPDFVARHGRPVTPDCPATLPVIASQDERGVLPTTSGAALSSANLQPRMRSPNAALRLQAAMAGIGVARITATYCERAALDGRLQRLLPDHVCDPRPTVCLAARVRPASARVRVFLQTLIGRGSKG